MSPQDKCILLGDLNARMPNLDVFRDDKSGLSYAKNKDAKSNQHGSELTNLCASYNICPGHHMVLHQSGIKFKGNLTFRQKTWWVSQIDWVLCSKSCLSSITDFQDTPMRTNHAAPTLSLSMPKPDVQSLLERSRL